MDISIIPVYKNLDGYIADVESKVDSVEILWDKYAIDPYWETLCQYAPYDLTDRKPKPVTNIPTLKKQIELLNKINLTKLKDEFIKIALALPNYDDDPIYVAIYPLSDDNSSIKELQNGVVGASTFGNMLININPLANDFKDWIPYVFAHEYHHTVWGNYWYALHGGELDIQFINSLLIDGEADSFALSFYPQLKPKWLFDLSESSEQILWKRHYSKIILKQNVDYSKYMFGDKKSQIPWCAGYTVGFRIVQKFLIKNPDITFRKLVEMRPFDIYEGSGYQVPL
ncbi:DUF2268 domain-containing putative Zn-dependent protease [Kineothrix sedimenti]|uniref:DUF2268 domain-containing putative Zn-dependent protease n=1 Tax=Kineothrix sedimenti TaxID=3123317 RepID=A0ABZ3ET60_9FIRM